MCHGSYIHRYVMTTWIFDGPTVERTDDRYDYVKYAFTRLVSSTASRLQIYTDRDPDERHIISAWRSEPQ